LILEFNLSFLQFFIKRREIIKYFQITIIKLIILQMFFRKKINFVNIAFPMFNMYQLYLKFYLNKDYLPVINKGKFFKSQL